MDITDQPQLNVLVRVYASTPGNICALKSCATSIIGT